MGFFSGVQHHSTETKDRHKHSQCYNVKIQRREIGIQNSSPMSSHVLGLNIILDFVITKENQNCYKCSSIQWKSVAGMWQVPWCSLRAEMDKLIPDVNFLMSVFLTLNKAVRNLQLHTLRLPRSPNKRVSRHHIPSRCCLASHEVTPRGSF